MTAINEDESLTAKFWFVGYIVGFEVVAFVAVKVVAVITMPTVRVVVCAEWHYCLRRIKRVGRVKRCATVVKEGLVTLKDTGICESAPRITAVVDL